MTEHTKKWKTIKFRLKKVITRWHNEDWMSDIVWYIPQYKLEHWNRYYNMKDWHWIARFQNRLEAKNFLSLTIKQWLK